MNPAATESALEASLRTLDILLIIGGIFVAIGVVGESVFGFLHWRKSEQLNALQKSTIARLNHETEQLKASGREFERALAPRWINADVSVDPLRKYAGTPLSIQITDDALAHSGDASKFALGLFVVMQKAGWSVKQVNEPGVTHLLSSLPIKDVEILTYGRSMTIPPSESESDELAVKAAYALRDFIEAQGIRAYKMSTELAIPRESVLVVVGRAGRDAGERMD